MKVTVSFRETDVGLVKNNFLDPTVRTMDGIAVDVTGWTMTESQRGTYDLDLDIDPNGRYTIYFRHLTNPLIFYDGWIQGEAWDQQMSEHVIPGSAGQYLQSIGITTDPWLTTLPNGYGGVQAGAVLIHLQEAFDKFTTSIGQMLARTYQAGLVTAPGAPSSGETLVLYANSDHSDNQFTLSDYWVPFLQDADTEVWFVVRSNNPKQTTPLLSAQGSVYDAVARVCRLNLTASQMALAPGEYSWQLQLRKDTVNPAQKRNALEGKLLVKPTF